MISEYTVAWVAIEHADAAKIASEWIGSSKGHVACSGWSSYSGLLATVPDSSLDLSEIESLLQTIENEIGGAENRVKYNMNGFLIAVGAYVNPLLEQAQATAQRIGKVSVDVGDTACEVRLATEAIKKIETSGKVGQKRKTIRC